MESLGFANIMYDAKTRKITGLLDYEDCIGGDPLFEILWMKYYFEHDNKDQKHFNFDRFESGYGKIEYNSKRMSIYSPTIYLNKLQWIEPKGKRAQAYVEKLYNLTGP
jgi:hypothetical protein